MKKIASLSRILEGIIMNSFPRRRSLRAIILSLSALPLSAADVTYLAAITAADTVTIEGAAPGAFIIPANMMKIGDRVNRTTGNLFAGGTLSVTGTATLVPIFISSWS